MIHWKLRKLRINHHQGYAPLLVSPITAIIGSSTWRSTFASTKLSINVRYCSFPSNTDGADAAAAAAMMMVLLFTGTGTVLFHTLSPPFAHGCEFLLLRESMSWVRTKNAEKMKYVVPTIDSFL
jgi:hypothetical protein